MTMEKHVESRKRKVEDEDASEVKRATKRKPTSEEKILILVKRSVISLGDDTSYFACVVPAKEVSKEDRELLEKAHESGMHFLDRKFNPDKEKKEALEKLLFGEEGLKEKYGVSAIKPIEAVTQMVYYLSD